MSDDLVKRLRLGNTTHVDARLDMFEAADRIEELEAKLKTSEEIGRAHKEDARQLRDKLARAVEALKFYGNEDHYSGEYIPDKCGCCGSWYEPKIHKDGEDSGDLARATLAELTGGKNE